MDALKPCPFCGGAVRLERPVDLPHYAAPDQWWGVVCRNTLNVGGTCAIEQRASRTKEAAIGRWNFRAGEALASGGEALAALEIERANQWRLRREAEGDRDLEKAVAATFQAQRDEARATLKYCEGQWSGERGTMIDKIQAERARADRAVAALTAIAEGNLGDAPWQADYEKIRKVARAAIDDSTQTPLVTIMAPS